VNENETDRKDIQDRAALRRNMGRNEDHMTNALRRFNRDLRNDKSKPEWPTRITRLRPARSIARKTHPMSKVECQQTVDTRPWQSRTA
jgi:hypothetical protein